MRSDVAALVTLALAMLGSVAGCTKSEPLTQVDEGRQVYLVNCTQCHNPDPTKPGTQGPEIAGASRELIEDRVLHLSYPPGYKPKRATHAMTAMPQLASKIDVLTAYLAEAVKDQGK